jgi:protoporphyrinogen oxidase
LEQKENKRAAVIIGAGPAGLTAALELLRRTDIEPVVVEAEEINGGISQTREYRGNRIDIGGHRFFSKSDRVMDWWRGILPVDPEAGQGELEIHYQNKSRRLALAGDRDAPQYPDEILMVRSRTSRIYYGRRLYDYPISLSLNTLGNLGLKRTAKIGFSYLKALLKPIRNERTLEDFLVNRFGRELYATFFRDYTHKVWGRSCQEIPAEWGAQRIKGLSVTRAIWHALKKLVGPVATLSQKSTETSLIEYFLYPRLGPGQMWDVVARKIREGGGEIRYCRRATGIERKGNRVTAVWVTGTDGRETRIACDYCFSTMPIRDLSRALRPGLPHTLAKIAEELPYRDFITVGLLVTGLKVTAPDGGLIPDNWIYIQEPDVRLGRLQIFNNWSPYMVADPGKVWIGLEYFCNEGDEFWAMSDEDLITLGARELAAIDIIEPGAVLDGVVIRMPKAYPAYFGSYPQLPELVSELNHVENLFLVGRNGMHRYNNQDHSMLAAMTAVDNIIAGVKDKSNIWSVNTEDSYHESRDG